ncbi:MAG: FecR domain-containing protein [Pseudomonadota bacterium]
MPKKIYTLILFSLIFCLSSHVYAENWFYTFKKGDTVWDFSRNSLNDWQHWDDIVKLNKITQDQTIQPGTQIAIPIKWLKQRVAKIRVRKVNGQVSVQLANSKRSLVIKSGMRIGLGDTIKTGKNSTVQLIFEDKTLLTLLEQSDLVFVTATMIGGESLNSSNIKARITKGRVNIHANPNKQVDNRFEILTNAGNSAVRGTQFRINASQISTHTEVLSGKVHVSNQQGYIDLPTGFGTLTRVGKKPLPPIVLLEPPNIEHLPRKIRYLPSSIQLHDSNPKIASYRVQILKKLEPEIIVMDQTSKNSVFFSQLLADGEYIVRVRAIDKLGLEGKTAEYVMHLDVRPEAPFQQQPIDSHIQGAGEIEFKWSKPENISQYLLEISNEKNFQASSVQKYNLTDNDYSRQIEIPGNYYWRVSSIDKSGKMGPPSTPSTVLIVPKPKQPELQKVAIDEQQLILKWRDAGANMHYVIQFSSDSKFTTLLNEQTVNQPQFTLERPEGGTFYFRAKTISSDNIESHYSPVQKVDVPSLSYWPAIFTTLLVLILIL